MKDIETTINIHADSLYLLNQASRRTALSRSKIICLLMNKIVIGNLNILIKSFTRIAYQKRDEKENWYRFHITLTPGEYEHLLDMRKVFKMSVSFILCFAIKEYLNEILSELEIGSNITDNYRLNNYVCTNKTVDGIICWLFYWGISPEMMKKTESFTNLS